MNSSVLNQIDQTVRFTHHLRYIPGQIALCGFLALTLIGCGGPSDAPDIAETTGTVTFENGDPVQFASIGFQSKSLGVLSIGRTDAEGNYRMLYKKGKWGAPIGPNIVTISQSKDQEDNLGSAVPEQFAMAKTSDLTADVSPSGENNFDFVIPQE
ncbi:carboxypeptidase regulatory-like domain-containing protein [Stratiformator vulcanicus]|uniref:Carboxypeptidase regulatory-like domain-containing protein n=1 Tax=Stratiformator vulcanicus TaxID=2527980 RepID=A0A517R4V6_9PLAN|nr:carboxypeptidase regulatory-like domain-containing protein [Stratiformator vulcanicus]QDT38917.1 hypothetical protein Pan189_33160 [Stratiformator vulcanicus]